CGKIEGPAPGNGWAELFKLLRILSESFPNFSSQKFQNCHPNRVIGRYIPRRRATKEIRSMGTMAVKDTLLMDDRGEEIFVYCITQARIGPERGKAMYLHAGFGDERQGEATTGGRCRSCIKQVTASTTLHSWKTLRPKSMKQKQQQKKNKRRSRKEEEEKKKKKRRRKEEE
ncbi:Protein of unknown function, partial [Gryllus bimaculatus]